MQFNRVDPPDELKAFVECYWIAESADSLPRLQKIIPDGFPEVIFHFADPYRIKLTNHWELQCDSLIAGQISKYFFLENSGASNILGIKLKPAALAQLLGANMFLLKDKVIALGDLGNRALNDMHHSIRAAGDHAARINIINQHIAEMSRSAQLNPTLQQAVDVIFSSHGMISISSICEQCDTRERQLERLFKKCIGLTPKFFSRVIRFSHIFQVAQEEKLSWSEVGLESGFYDQPHFIKNFKAFTGEDPSQYFFDEPNLANFFMKKV